MDRFREPINDVQLAETIPDSNSVWLGQGENVCKGMFLFPVRCARHCRATASGSCDSLSPRPEGASARAPSGLGMRLAVVIMF